MAELKEHYPEVQLPTPDADKSALLERGNAVSSFHWLSSKSKLNNPPWLTLNSSSSLLSAFQWQAGIGATHMSVTSTASLHY